MRLFRLQSSNRRRESKTCSSWQRTTALHGVDSVLRSPARCAGVEMEALTAVATAALTVYDMCKAVSKTISITDIRLEAKHGGRSGDWSRDLAPK